MQLSISNYTVLFTKGSFDMSEKTGNITKKKSCMICFLLLAHPFQDENKTTAGAKKSI